MIEVELRLGERLPGDVSLGLFGGFVEHFGRGLYGGLWDLGGGHPRADVQAAVRGLGVTNLRYPGGCFADWYHWRDGVGPPAERPFHARTYWTDLHARGIAVDPALAARLGPPEPNAFGTDEFLRYCDDVGAEPLLTANFGTGTPEEAADWVRYTKGRVRWWFVGNEIDEPSELGHCAPDEYGRRLREFAAAMREADPDVRVIAVGRCVPGGAEDWNRRMIEAAADAVDMVSLHYYFPGYGLGRDLADNDDELRQRLAGARTMGEGLDWALSEIDAFGPPGLPVAIDEWSMWSAWDDLVARNHSLCDSVYFGGCLNRMIERADRVRFAMISHLVNSLAPIQTNDDRMHVTAAYLTLRLYRSAVRRHRLALEVQAPLLDVPTLPHRAHNKPLGGTTSDIREVPAVDAVATADDQRTALLVCSGTLDEPIRATIHGLPPRARGRARWITGPGPFARNTFDAPATLGYAMADAVADASGSCTLDLQPATVTALEVAARGQSRTSRQKRSACRVGTVT